MGRKNKVAQSEHAKTKRLFIFNFFKNNLLREGRHAFKGLSPSKTYVEWSFTKYLSLLKQANDVWLSA